MSNWNYKCLNGTKCVFFLPFPTCCCLLEKVEQLLAPVGTRKKSEKWRGRALTGLSGCTKFTPLCLLLTPPQINQSNEYLWGLDGWRSCLKSSIKRMANTHVLLVLQVERWNGMISWALIQIVTYWLLLNLLDISCLLIRSIQLYCNRCKSFFTFSRKDLVFSCISIGSRNVYWGTVIKEIPVQNRFPFKNYFLL